MEKPSRRTVVSKLFPSMHVRRLLGSLTRGIRRRSVGASPASRHRGRFVRSVRFLYEEESSLPADGRAKRDFPPPPFLRKALGTATTLAHSPKYRCSTLLAAILDVSHSVHLAVFLLVVSVI